MKKYEALKAAQREADGARAIIIVVNAPIENAEEGTPFGYCALEAKNILYRYGTVVAIVLPRKDRNKFHAQLLRRIDSLKEVASAQHLEADRQRWEEWSEEVAGGTVRNKELIAWLREEASNHLPTLPRYSAFLCSLIDAFDLIVS